jgi:glycolate oxidase iron-sulfur subunit
LNQPDENEYLRCIRCGLCLAVCPTYREFLNETASPRGRVALVRKGLSAEPELSPNLVEQMYGCFTCKACDEICPAGVHPAELILAMRQVQEQLHPTLWKKMLFQSVIPKPGRLEFATLPLRLYEMSGVRHLTYTLGIRRIMPSRLRDMEAMLPRLPKRPLRHALPEVTKATGTSHHRVGFFLGCAQSLLFADASAATLRVLARNGCTVITPKNIVCCGMPATGYGRQDLAREQARHNISLFEQARVEVVITDCATCGSTLKEYGCLLKDDPEWSERAASFSCQVRDVSEFLAAIPLKKPPGHLDARVTYHDPCHLRRGQGVWKEPRALLRMIDGVNLVELPEADWCCGSAGSQLITHYDTSLRMMMRKMDQVEATQAQFVASGCPGCQMQLNAGVRRRKMITRVVHPMELLDQAYNKGQGC